jgi:signal transduction histidine kinase
MVALSHNVRITIWTIIIVIGVLIVGMWVAAGFSLVTSRQATLAQASSEGRNLTIAFREEVAFILRGVEGETNLIAERMRRERGSFDLYAWGQENVLISPGIAQATIIGPDGQLRSTTIEPHPSSTDLSDREHFRVHLDGKFHGLFIGQTVIGRISGVPLLPISRRVDAEDGTFLGVLVMLISPSSLTTLHKSIDLGRHGVMTLSGLDDILRARFAPDSPEGIVGIGRSIAGGPRPALIGEQAEGWFVRTSVMDGIPRLYAYGRVGSYPLVVTVGLDLDHELAVWRSNAAMIIAMALGATLLLTGLAAYLIREIRVRAAHEAKLAEERTKLLVTNIALAESKEGAEAASRAKSLFLANMSHELRTPLNAIIGYSEIIKDQTFGPTAAARYTEYAGDIHNAGHHLLSLIVDILDTAKLDAGKFVLEEEIVDLAVLVDRSVAQLRLAIESKRLELELTIPDDLPRVRGDASRLNQVMINLLSNAVKFTPEGGHIRVSMACNAAGEMISEVSDTGIGMSTDDIAIALEPFLQVENALTKNYEGTGLGLPLAQRLVELHGGIMEIESQRGCGTTVRVRLPAERTVSTQIEKITADGRHRLIAAALPVTV